MLQKQKVKPAQGTIKEFIENYELYQAWARRGLDGVVNLFLSTQEKSTSDKFELLTYSIDRPQRFFDRTVYKSIRDMLFSANLDLVRDIPETIQSRFENSITLLRSYNQQYEEPYIDYREHKESLRYYLHEHVFGDYLQLSENIYVSLLRHLLFVFYSQNASRHKNFTQGLVNDEPRKIIEQATKHFKLPAVFDPLIRNAIAHGGIGFDELEVKFIDKNGEYKACSLNEARGIADRLLDACNGVLAALSEYLISNRKFSNIFPLLTQQEIAKMRTAFVSPEIFYFVDRADGKQMEIHGTCRHWQWEELQLDIMRCLIIAKDNYPSTKHFSISLTDDRGIPHFYHVDTVDIPCLTDDVRSISSLHNIMQKNGMSWIEHRRLVIDLIGKIPRAKTLFHWANEISWVYDPKGTMPGYELRSLKDISVKHHSRFNASVISKPRSIDLDDDFLPTNEYLSFLYRETVIRWMIREDKHRNYGASRIRFFKTGIFFVYSEDRRLANLSDDEDNENGSNLLFRFEAPLPMFSPLRMPGLGGGPVRKVGTFYVSVNPLVTGKLQEIRLLGNPKP